MRSFLLVVAVCLALGTAVAQSPEEKAFQAKQAELATKIKGVMALEDDRARVDRCQHTVSGSNEEFQNCISNEFKRTDGDYTTLVLTLGAYLRLREPGSPPVKPGRISFDEAETGWQTYRAQICDAVYQTYGIGTAGPGAYVDCKVKVTQSHMKELVAMRGVFSR